MDNTHQEASRLIWTQIVFSYQIGTNFGIEDVSSRWERSGKPYEYHTPPWACFLCEETMLEPRTCGLSSQINDRPLICKDGGSYPAERGSDQNGLWMSVEEWMYEIWTLEIKHPLVLTNKCGKEAFLLELRRKREGSVEAVELDTNTGLKGVKGVAELSLLVFKWTTSYWSE